jgi:hypothetical protein
MTQRTPHAITSASAGESPTSLAFCASYANFTSSNKFRDIMKRFEAAGTTSNGNAAATKKTATKRAKPGASKKGPATAEVEDEDGEDENEEVEPPKKKAE